MVGHILLGVLVAVLGVDAAGIWAASRLVRYGTLRRPRPREVVNLYRRPLPVAAPLALPAAQAVVQGVVISHDERIRA